MLGVLAELLLTFGFGLYHLITNSFRVLGHTLAKQKGAGRKFFAFFQDGYTLSLLDGTADLFERLLLFHGGKSRSGY